MARIAEEAILYQIKRSLRADWRRFWKSGYENDPLYKLYERAERKFDPKQPRVPRGQPEGGQWMGGAGSQTLTATVANEDQQGSDTNTTTDDDNQLGGLMTADRAAACMEQYRLDSFICRTVRTASCWRQAAFRLGQCMSGGYVPEIYH